MRRSAPVPLASMLLTLLMLYGWVFGETWPRSQWQIMAPLLWGALVAFPLLLRSTHPDRTGNRILVSDPGAILQRTLFVASVVIGTLLANNLMLRTRGEPAESLFDALDILVAILVVISLLGWYDRRDNGAERGSA